MIELLQSKKFIASILASILAFAGIMYGFDASQIALVVGPLAIYTGSQGLSDFGKEKAIAEKVFHDIVFDEADIQSVESAKS